MRGVRGVAVFGAVGFCEARGGGDPVMAVGQIGDRKSGEGIAQGALADAVANRPDALALAGRNGKIKQRAGIGMRLQSLFNRRIPGISQTHRVGRYADHGLIFGEQFFLLGAGVFMPAQLPVGVFININFADQTGLPMAVFLQLIHIKTRCLDSLKCTAFEQAL